MAMMMNIPSVPATPMANSGSKGEPAAKGTEGTFQTALSEEGLNQAQGSEAKTKQKKAKESHPEADSAEGTATAGAANIQPPKTPETSPAGGDAAVVEAAPEVAAVLPDRETTAIAPEPSGAGATAAKVKGTAPTPAPQGSVHEIPTAAIEASASEKPVSGAPSEAASNATSAKVAETTAAGKVQPPATDLVVAANQEIAPKAKGLFQGPAAMAASEVARQQIGQRQQQMTERPDLGETNNGRAGLLEASFAGILHPSTGKGHALKENSAPESAEETVGIQLQGEQADASAAIRLTANGEADADLSGTLLKQAAGRPESLEPGQKPGSGDIGQPSVFDSTLAAAGAGKNPLEGQAGPVQGSATTLAPFTATSPNQEVQILDQVLEQLPLHRIGDRNRIVIRLHPEELGEVKLDLVMDKDQLKAHMVAQTQQVQEILEKHLPRLQEALHNQGVKLDDIQVSVDSQRNQGREFNDRNQQPAPFARSFGYHRAPAEPAPAVAATGSTGSGHGGLSLRI